MIHVLVFESDHAFARELETELARYGCTVQVVDDANVGLQAAAIAPPSLILLSVELPKVNGYSVCNKLKKDPRLKDVPLILLSSESSDETFEQHKKLRTRAEDYVHKPIAAFEVVACARRFVAIGERAQSHYRAPGARENEVLGHDRSGSGPRNVIVLNDWLCDTSTWDGARNYLDGESFSWVFGDLRGYGRSRAQIGACTVLEAATDVLALADAIGWSRFAIVGHSMSTLVAVHLAQHHANRIERAVLLTPPPPSGFGADDAMIESARALARADDSTRGRALAQRFGDRLSRGFTSFKAARFRSSADPEAAARYVAMFARDGVPHPTARIAVPVLAITGEKDIPPMRRDGVMRALSPICDHLEVIALADSGHYPMEEMPPLTVALVERFLMANSS